MPFLYSGSKPPSKRPRSGVVSAAEAQALFTEYYGRLYPSAVKFAGRFVDDPEDVVGEAFTDLWVSCFKEGDVDPAGVKELFVQILRRRIADTLREGSRILKRDEDPEHVLSISARIENQMDVERVAEGKALAARLEYIVDTMPEASRRVYRRVLSNEGDVRAAAEELKITYNTARWHLTRATEFIRAALVRDGYAVPATLNPGRRGRGGRSDK